MVEQRNPYSEPFHNLLLCVYVQKSSKKATELMQGNKGPNEYRFQKVVGSVFIYQYRAHH